MPTAPTAAEDGGLSTYVLHMTRLHAKRPFLVKLRVINGPFEKVDVGFRVVVAPDWGVWVCSVQHITGLALALPPSAFARAFSARNMASCVCVCVYVCVCVCVCVRFRNSKFPAKETIHTHNSAHLFLRLRAYRIQEVSDGAFAC